MLSLLTKPYRVTTEVLKTFTDGHQETVRVMNWYDTDGNEITDADRIAELEANLATSQGASYVPR